MYLGNHQTSDEGVSWLYAQAETYSGLMFILHLTATFVLCALGKRHLFSVVPHLLKTLVMICEDAPRYPHLAFINI